MRIKIYRVLESKISVEEQYVSTQEALESKIEFFYNNDCGVQKIEIFTDTISDVPEECIEYV